MGVLGVEVEGMIMMGGRGRGKRFSIYGYYNHFLTA